MDILVLGGTQFVGRHIVEHAVVRGDRVTILTRGRSRDELPAMVERLRGDRNDGAAGLAALEGRRWDACIDVSGYTPPQVRASAELLRDSVGRYVFVSTVSVYADSSVSPITETHPRSEPASNAVTTVTAETYGPLKVACEDIVAEVYGERAAMLRPQIVAGAHDHTARYPCWVQRAAQGSEMIAPGDGSDHLQVVDVRDVACFARIAVEHRLSGPFNLSGPRLTWAAFMQLLGVTEPVWVPASVLSEEGVSFAELPLYIPDRAPRSHVMDVSSAKAQDAGLVLTDPAETVRAVRAWLTEAPVRAALAAERERVLIHRARQPSLSVTARERSRTRARRAREAPPPPQRPLPAT